MSAGDSEIHARFAGAFGSFGLDIDFRAPMRGITALFGPSGCGKTTILRCTAGLQHAAGSLTVGDGVWQDDALGVFRKPHQRPIGYVFQEASLFPHLSVRGNLLYGSRRAARDGAPAVFGFDDVVGLLAIGHLLERAPAALSGGERQRVAVGRALLAQPRLLLMDEPLAALDRAARNEILPYFERMHEELSMPVLYVSHDLGECERLADTLVLIENGRVRASGPLADLEADAALPLLREADAAVVVTGRVTAIDDGYTLTSLAVPGGCLVIPGRWGNVDDFKRLRIKASDVSFVRERPETTTILNCLPARILSVAPYRHDDAQVNLIASLGEDGAGARIVSRITRKSLDAMALAPGAAVFAQIKSAALVAR